MSELSGLRISFPLAGTNHVEIVLKDRISQAEFELIVQVLALSKDSLVEPELDPPAKKPEVDRGPGP